MEAWYSSRVDFEPEIIPTTLKRFLIFWQNIINLKEMDDKT